MRDILVLAMTAGGAFLGLARPWLGVLALAVFAYLNPHRYAWGFSRSFPVYFIVFAATMFGIMFNAPDRRPFPWTRETKLFAVLLAWFTLTTFWGPDYPKAAHDQWVKVMKIYAGVFPALWMITTKERLKWFIVTVALSFGLLGLKGGIFAAATGFHYRVWGPDNTFYGGNNEIALALNMTLPLLVLCAKESRRPAAKAFFWATFMFSVFSIVSSWSRGGLVTLVATLLALIVSGRKKWLAVPLVIVGAVVLVPKLPEKWFARMETIETYDQDASVRGRFMAWRYATNRALKSPLTGGGFETFRSQPHDAHSAYFEILGEHGFIALALWLSLLFGTMVALERLRIYARYVPGAVWIRDYARAVQISLLAYAVGGAFLGVAYWDYFYHLVAVCVILKLLFQEAYESQGAAAEGVPAPRPAAPPGVPVPSGAGVPASRRGL